MSYCLVHLWQKMISIIQLILSNTVSNEKYPNLSVNLFSLWLNSQASHLFWNILNYFQQRNYFYSVIIKLKLSKKIKLQTLELFKLFIRH